jgi:EamA domain-containing membrane protein RarD
MQWDQALEVFIPWFLTVSFALYVLIRIATKAGFGTGLAILFGISMPIGLIYLAFAEWPLSRQLRALSELRKTSGVGGRTPVAKSEAK